MNTNEVLEDAIKVLERLEYDIEVDVTTLDEFRNEIELVFMRSIPVVKLILQRELELGTQSPLVVALAKAIIDGKTWV